MGPALDLWLRKSSLGMTFQLDLKDEEARSRKRDERALQGERMTCANALR